MNNTFKANLIKTLANKKGNKGFTLIELLVVVIIIGVLAAIALPNLLGQVGKARESEAKSTLGAMNRAQQTVFAERGRFASSMAEVEVPVGNEKFYAIFLDQGADTGTANNVLNGRMGAVGVTRDDTTGAITAFGATPNGANGTRDYAAGINYDNVARTFSAVVCRPTNDAANTTAQYILHDGTAIDTNDPKAVTATVTGLGSGGVTNGPALAECNETAGAGQTEEVK